MRVELKKEHVYYRIIQLSAASQDSMRAHDATQEPEAITLFHVPEDQMTA